DEESEDGERRGDAVIAGRVDDALAERTRLDPDAVAEGLGTAAQRGDRRGDRGDAIGLLLTRVTEAVELRGRAGLCRDRGEGGEHVGAVRDVRHDAKEVTCAAHRRPRAGAPDRAAHVLDELEEARVALTALLAPRRRVLDRDGAAEDRGRRGRIRRGGHVARYLARPALDLPRGDDQEVPGRALDDHAAPRERRDRHVEERRRDDGAGEAQAQAPSHARRDEQERRGELARLVARDRHLAAFQRTADRERQGLPVDGCAERSQRGDQRRHRTLAHARRAVDPYLTPGRRGERGREAGDRSGIVSVDGGVLVRRVARRHLDTAAAPAHLVAERRDRVRHRVDVGAGIEPADVDQRPSGRGGGEDQLAVGDALRSRHTHARAREGPADRRDGKSCHGMRGYGPPVFTRGERIGQAALVAVALVFAFTVGGFLFGRGGTIGGAAATASATGAPKPPEVTFTQETCCTQTARFMKVSWTASEKAAAVKVTVTPDPGFPCDSSIDASGLKGVVTCQGLLRGSTDYTASLALVTARGTFPYQQKFRTMGDRLTNVPWFTEFEDPKGDPLACAAASVRMVQSFTAGTDPLSATQILQQGQAFNKSKDPGIDPAAIATMQKRLDARNNYHYYRFATREEATKSAIYWLVRSGK